MKTIQIEEPLDESTPSLTYDPASGNEYVLLDYDYEILVLSPSYKFVATISLPTASQFAGYDPANHDIYVTAYRSTQGLVYVVPSSTNKIVQTVEVGSAPDYLSYDAANQDEYLTDVTTDFVWVSSSS